MYLLPKNNIPPDISVVRISPHYRSKNGSLVPIGPSNKSMVTLSQFILSKEMRKEAKPQGENPPSRKDMKSNSKNVELLVLLLLQTKC